MNALNSWSKPEYDKMKKIIFLCRIMIFLASVAATLVFFDHSGDIIHINISTFVGVEPTEVEKKSVINSLFLLFSYMALWRSISPRLSKQVS